MDRDQNQERDPDQDRMWAATRLTEAAVTQLFQGASTRSMPAEDSRLVKLLPSYTPLSIPARMSRVRWMPGRPLPKGWPLRRPGLGSYRVPPGSVKAGQRPDP